MRAWILIAAVLATGCGSDVGTDLMQAVGLRQERYIRRGVSVTFSVDPAFNAREREELAQAALAVRNENILVTLVEGDAEGAMLRGRPSFGAMSEDAKGAFSRELLSLWVVADLPEMQEPGAVCEVTASMLRDMTPD